MLRSRRLRSRLALACALGLAAPARGADDGLALLRAAQAGDEAELVRLLDVGVDVDFLPPDAHHMRLTALEVAARFGHRAVLERLLAHGAALRSDTRRCLYAGSFAAMHDDPAMLEAIWRAAKPAEDPTPLFGCALVEAARQGNDRAVRWLLDRAVDPNFHTRGDAYPNPAVVVAAGQAHFELLRELVDAGANPDPDTPRMSIPPLYSAASGADVEVVDYLLAHGADPHRRTRFGNGVTVVACTPIAGNREHADAVLQVARRFIEVGVSVNVANDKRSPLACARRAFHAELAALLEAHGAVERETLRTHLGRALYALGLLIGGGH